MKKLFQNTKENNKATMIILIAIIALLLVVGTSTFAFFRAQTIQGTESDIGLKSGTTDSLTFIQGDAIYINANMNNFTQGLANLTDETDASAQLIANDATNQATQDYNVFFIIDTNDFDYTTEDEQAEIVLRVWDPNGTEITNITGLNYQNTDNNGNPLPDDEKGFDITTRTGGFLVSADYIIEAALQAGETGTASTMQSWYFEVTLINLDAVQNENKGKSLNARILMTTEQSPTYEITQINSLTTISTYNSIETLLQTTSASKGTNEVLNYYYSIDGGSSYTTAQGSTYTFGSLAENTKYNIMVKVEDTAGRYSVEYPLDVTTDAYNLPKVSNATTTTTSNAITVNATSTNGDGTVQTYYFSRDNGSNWYSSTTGSYTFNTLTSGVTYTISIKVVDNNDRESAVYTTTATTLTMSVTANVASSTAGNNGWYKAVSISATTTNAESGSTIKYCITTSTTCSPSTTYSSAVAIVNNTTATRVCFNVTDKAGNVSATSCSSAYSVDNVVPTISTFASTSVGTNSITVSVSASDSHSQPKTYYYSSNGGSSYTSSTSSSYTFSGLSSNTTYSLKAYVVDSAGNQSAVTSLSITTDYSRYVYYSDSGSASLLTVDLGMNLYRCEMDGSNCTSIDTMYGGYNGYGTIPPFIEAGSNYLYYTDSGSASANTVTLGMDLYRCELDGTNCTEIETLYGGNTADSTIPPFIEVGNQYLYFTDSGSASFNSLTMGMDLYRCALNGTNCTNIERIYGGNTGYGTIPPYIKVGNQYLYFTDSGNASVNSLTLGMNLYRCDLDGANCTSVQKIYGGFNTDRTIFPTIEVGNEYLYFTDSGSAGLNTIKMGMNLYRCDLKGTTCTNIQSVYGAINGYGAISPIIEVGNEYLYYTSSETASSTTITMRMYLYRCDLDGTNCSQIQTLYGAYNNGGTIPPTVEVGEEYLYYTTSETGSTSTMTLRMHLYRCDLDGTNCTKLNSAYGGYNGNGTIPVLISLN